MRFFSVWFKTENVASCNQQVDWFSYVYAGKRATVKYGTDVNAVALELQVKIC